MKRLFNRFLTITLAVILVLSTNVPVYAIEDLPVDAESIVDDIEDLDESVQPTDETEASQHTEDEDFKEDSDEKISEDSDSDEKISEDSDSDEISLEDSDEVILEDSDETEETYTEIDVSEDLEDSEDTEPDDSESEFTIPDLNYMLAPGEGDYDSIWDHLNDSIPSPDRATTATYSVKYDPTDQNTTEGRLHYLPPVRNQNPYGTCWAHAVMGAAEINIALNSSNKSNTASAINLSELQLAKFMYHSPSNDPLGNTAIDSNYMTNSSANIGPDGVRYNFLSRGGSIDFAKKIIKNWIGAGNDAGKLAYSNADAVLRNAIVLNDSDAYNDTYHLQEYININFSNRDEVKYAIKNYGSVTVSYYHNDNYYSSSAAINNNKIGFYCPNKYSVNHAVLIVGWDDNFPVSNFKSNCNPGRPGAWLVRNSWGFDGTSENSMYKYFWMSYYDQSLTGGVAMRFEPASNYDNNYHYDGAAMDYSVNLASGSKYANVFTINGSSSSQILKAVSFETKESNVSYKINVYKLSGTKPVSNPENGTLIASASGTKTYSGYYTIPLSPTELKKGNIFSVVVILSHSDGSNVSIYREDEYLSQTSWFNCKTGANPGESFYKEANSSSWRDINATGNLYYGETGNLRINAFTQNKSTSSVVSPSSLTLDKSTCSLKVGESYTLTPTILPSNANNKSIIWSSSNQAVAKVSGGKITAISIGSATITAKAQGNIDISATCTVKVKPASLGSTECRGQYYGTNGYKFIWDKIPDASYYELTYYEDTTSNSMFEIISGLKNTSYTCKDGFEEGKLYGAFVIGYYEDVQSEKYNKFTFIYSPVHSITYVLNGGTNNSGNPTSYNITTNTITLLDPTRTGYKFAGWYATSTLTGTAVTTIPKGSKGNKTFYAKWIPVTYTVRYNGNGATSGSMSDSSMTYDKNAALRANVFSRTGYTFLGWSTSASDKNVSYTDSQTVCNLAAKQGAIVNLYAQWKTNNGKNPGSDDDKKPGDNDDDSGNNDDEQQNEVPNRGLEPADVNTYYVVTFIGNGATAGYTPDEGFSYGQKFPLNDCGYVRKGYIFKCWNTKKDGKGKSYKPGKLVKNLTKKRGKVVKLYAIWTPIKYTVSYDKNGGTGKMKNVTVKYGKKYSLSPNKFKRKGYKFMGWSLKPNGEVAYKNKKSIKNLTYKAGEKITLYAVWMPK